MSACCQRSNSVAALCPRRAGRILVYMEAVQSRWEARQLWIEGQTKLCFDNAHRAYGSALTLVLGDVQSDRSLCGVGGADEGQGSCEQEKRFHGSVEE